MFTGKRPTDEMFNDSLNIHNFAKAALQKQVIEIVDPILFQETEDHFPSQSKTPDTMMAECLTIVFEIGVTCSAESPRDRMSIREVIAELHRVRDKLLGTDKNFKRK
ncbi:hypothetical protein REPUB_Repub13aG0097200 [Reevesia pubescens]